MLKKIDPAWTDVLHIRREAMKMQLMKDGNKGVGQSRGAGRLNGEISKSAGNVIGAAHGLQERRLQHAMKAPGVGSGWGISNAAEEGERTVLRHASGGLQRQGEDGGRRNEVLNCPRCNSLNTKFCYYNNYSLLQPRHFCKNCRRYWTKGGALRNVPVGGGCRKNKRAHALAGNVGVSGLCVCACSTAVTVPSAAAAGAITVRNPASGHDQLVQPAAALPHNRLPPLPHHDHYLSPNPPPRADPVTNKTSLFQPSLISTSSSIDFAAPPKPCSPNSNQLTPTYPLLINAANCRPSFNGLHLPASHCAASFRSLLSFQQAKQSTFAIQPSAASSISLSYQQGKDGHNLPTHNFSEVLQTAPTNDPLMLVGRDLLTKSSTTAVPHVGTFTSPHGTSSRDAGMLFSRSSLELQGNIYHGTSNEADELGPKYDARQIPEELMPPFISTSTRSSLQPQIHQATEIDPGSYIKHELVSDNFKVDQPVVACGTAVVNYLLQPYAQDHHEAYWNSNVPSSATWPDNLSI